MGLCKSQRNAVIFARKIMHSTWSQAHIAAHVVEDIQPIDLCLMTK